MESIFILIPIMAIYWQVLRLGVKQMLLRTKGGIRFMWLDDYRPLTTSPILPSSGIWSYCIKTTKEKTR